MSRLFKPGEIIVYPYRWLGEAQAGRSPDGAKDRPCCVVVSVAGARLSKIAAAAKLVLTSQAIVHRRK